MHCVQAKRPNNNCNSNLFLFFGYSLSLSLSLSANKVGYNGPVTCRVSPCCWLVVLSSFCPSASASVSVITLSAAAADDNDDDDDDDVSPASLAGFFSSFPPVMSSPTARGVCSFAASSSDFLTRDASPDGALKITSSALLAVQQHPRCKSCIQQIDRSPKTRLTTQHARQSC